MSIYARIQSGMVAELFATDADISRMFHPSLQWIEVSSVKPAPQVGWSFNGHTFAPPAQTAPTSPIQTPISLLTAGCQIKSQSMPALDGTYPVDPRAQARMIAVQTRINAGAGLPHSAKTIDWFDVDGKAHTLTAEQFTTLFRVLTDFAYSLDMLALGHMEGVPDQPIAIP